MIRDHWKNVGMGFMPSHVAVVVLFAMSTGMYVYVENYGRYDWTRYFHGHAGLDLRWTPAKHRMWKVHATPFTRTRHVHSRRVWKACFVHTDSIHTRGAWTLRPAGIWPSL